MDKADMAVGMLVKHPTHGIGRVLSLGADSRMSPVLVDFGRLAQQISPDNLTAYAQDSLATGAL